MRPKNTAIQSAENTAENITIEPKEDSISLKFEEASDIAPKPEKPSRVKKLLSNVLVTTDEQEQAEKKTRRKVSRFFTKNIMLVVGALAFLINLLVPEEYKQVFYVNEQSYSYLPSDEQLKNIVEPLARIADRHTSIADISPDVMDLIASGQAAMVYGMELRATMLLKSHLDKLEKEKAQQNKMQEMRNNYNGFNA